jgi:hypothetical protein
MTPTFFINLAYAIREPGYSRSKDRPGRSGFDKRRRPGVIQVE